MMHDEEEPGSSRTRPLIHGEAGLARAQMATNLLGASGDVPEDSALDNAVDVMIASYDDVPAVTFTRADLEAGIPVLDIMVPALCKSRGEARRLIAGRGFRLNEVLVEDPNMVVGPDHLTRTLVIRSGKKKRVLVRVVP